MEGIKKTAKPKTPVSAKIMVFGTFDILHKGHLNFFKQARALSQKPYLVVSVARDRNVEKIKGFSPQNSEKQRAKLLKKVKLVDKVVLGGLKKHLPHIAKEAPRFIALGYDQKNYIRNLGKSLKKIGLGTKIVRLKAYRPHLYKSSIMKHKS